jgi:type IV pilus modification protein PilV
MVDTDIRARQPNARGSAEAPAQPAGRIATCALQLGFGLIESLVALLVISVGMIGIAGLYGHGLRANGTALYRTIAVNLAADMADRIRANRRGNAAYGRYGRRKSRRNCRTALVSCSTRARRRRPIRSAWRGTK